MEERLQRWRGSTPGPCDWIGRRSTSNLYGGRRPSGAARRARGVELSARPSPGEPVMVDADPARIEQILLILVDNALRHARPAGPSRSVWPATATRPPSRCATPARAAPPASQAFVFDRFYRGDVSREGRSAGLGLAIARGLAAAHQGGIDLKSAVGRYLHPAAAPAPRPARPRPHPRRPTCPARPPGNVRRVTEGEPTALVTGAGRHRPRLRAGVPAGGLARGRRRPGRPGCGADAYAGTGVHVTGLDVADAESVEHGIADAERHAGRALACLVVNAAYGVLGAVEEADLDEVRAMFETNLFGAAEVLQRVVPGMREAGRGAVVFVSSIGARISHPLLGMYHASKYALTAIAEALAARPPLRDPGVDGRAGDGGHRLLPGGAADRRGCPRRGPTPPSGRTCGATSPPGGAPTRSAPTSWPARWWMPPPRPSRAVPGHGRRRRANARGHARGHGRRPRLPRRALEFLDLDWPRSAS